MYESQLLNVMFVKCQALIFIELNKIPEHNESWKGERSS